MKWDRTLDLIDYERYATRQTCFCMNGPRPRVLGGRGRNPHAEIEIYYAYRVPCRLSVHPSGQSERA
jgi:hypothetical protein